MKSVSGKKFKKLLESKGWILSRISGSHHIFTKPGHKERISVPVHGKQNLKIGLLKHLMKIAGIEEDEL